MLLRHFCNDLYLSEIYIYCTPVRTADVLQIFIRTLNQIVHKMWLEEISTLAYISAQVLHFCKTPQAANNIRHTDENTSLPQ